MNKINMKAYSPCKSKLNCVSIYGDRRNLPFGETHIRPPDQIMVDATPRQITTLLQYANMIQLKVSNNLKTSRTKALLTLSTQTLLNCIDNSGASVVECVNVLKKKRPATIGQFRNPETLNI